MRGRPQANGAHAGRTPRQRFRLRFPEREIPYWADRYAYAGSDERLLDRVRPRVLERGHLTRAEFLRICAWKSVRTKPRCAENAGRDIRTVTRAALAAADEGSKMELLRMLRGVEWPTASTILHFCDARPYPILDYRALWSLGFIRPPKYTPEFWLEYVAFMRGLCARRRVPIRIADRALWQYSKERQPVRRAREEER